MTSTLQAILPTRDATTTLAWRSGAPISQGEFLRDVAALRERLPLGQPLLNLCADRYLFAVGFFAAALNECLSLLPHSITPESIAALQAAYPALQALVEAERDARGLPAIHVARCASGEIPQQIPALPREQIIARLFTSGSTGTPQAHDKRWGKLHAGAMTAAQAQWQRAGGPCAVVATVPAQHMFGFESSVLLPLLSGGILVAQHPFFPADVVAALAAAPTPRALVSTPFHLRTLIAAELPLPPTALIISATAPLSPALAASVEAATGGILGEIYGSTETGQIATRRTSSTPIWECFDGISLHNAEERSWVQGAHVEEPTPMGDILETQPAAENGRQRFILHGRLGDMINIAGKRSSLNYLNSVLCSIAGVVDGVFHLPQMAPADGIVRLAAFAVAPGLSEEALRAALRRHLDSVFMPRPLLLLDALPRSSSGKLPREALEALFNQANRARPLIGYNTLALDAQHPVFAGHFPGQPMVPGALLLDMAIESIERDTTRTVQTIAMSKFLSPATPGEPIELDYRIEAQDLRFEISSGGRKLAIGRLLLEPQA
jgi:acyl-coenzyme A synthetase/AMP-(fatty) acid ligase